jgi:perosamine synthetase
MKVIEEKKIGSLFGREEINILDKLFEKKNTLTRGPYLSHFEKEFSRLVGSKYSAGVTSCSAALEISAQLLRIKNGDEVLVQVNSFWKTVLPLIKKKAKIITVDTNSTNLQMSFEDLKKKITKKTKAVYLVSLGGYVDQIDKIYNYCKKKNIYLVQDAAHSVIYKYKNKPPARFADITCFSFSTLKNITTLGEGGMICVNKKNFYSESLKLRDGWPLGKKINLKKKKNLNLADYSFLRPGDYYQTSWNKIEEIGSTYKLSDPQAAVGLVQLKKLNKFIKIRKFYFDSYNYFLSNYKFVELIKYPQNLKPSYHLYSFFINKNNFFTRNDIVKRLIKKYKFNIVNRYWPIHLNSVFQYYNTKPANCKNFEDLYFNRQIDLPISASINIKEFRDILNRLKKCLNEFNKY